MDGEDTPSMKKAWRRAQQSWAFAGFPFIEKCVNKTPVHEENGAAGREWFIIAEDSAKLLPGASIVQLQSRIREAPPNVEIIQTGYRRTTGLKDMQLLDLETMRYIDGQANRVTKIMGQKLFLATRRGIELLKSRLLKGTQDYFDVSMCDLIRANVAMRDILPLAGSRAHYSLVDGGKSLPEEIPSRGRLIF